MSKQSVADIICDNCGHQFEKLVYSSVNVQQNPELRISILNGDFFKQQCPQCTFSIDSFYNVLYHDMKNKFMAWLIRPNNDNTIYFKPGTLAPSELLPEYRLSVSRYPFQWIERILTLELEVDPRIIELYKFGMKEEQNLPLESKNDFIHFSKYSKGLFGKMKFHWKLVYGDGTQENDVKAVNKDKYKSYMNLLESIGSSLDIKSWYLIDWQFSFGLEVRDGESIQLPLTSQIIEIGPGKTKLPKQFLEVAKKSGKSKQI